MYPLPVPGSDASIITKASLWRDLITMVNQWRQGRFTIGNENRRRGTIYIKNNTGRDVTAGELLQVTAMTQPADSSLGIGTNYSPILSADEPTWHTAIDNIVIADGPIRDGDLFPYNPRPFGIVSCTGSVGGSRYVMIDPVNPQYGITSDSGIFRVLGYDAVNDFAIVDRGMQQPLWRYELTQNSQAPSVTTAKLVTLDGTEFASSINLSDPLSIGDEDTSGYEGYCVQAGNEFHIAPGPCP